MMGKVHRRYEIERDADGRPLRLVWLGDVELVPTPGAVMVGSRCYVRREDGQYEEVEPYEEVKL